MSEALTAMTDITFTREEVKKHEAYCDRLRDQVRELEIENRRLRNIKLPPPTIDCACAFTEWYGYAVCTDMDIHTQVAWGNWQIAWNAALAHQGRIKEMLK